MAERRVQSRPELVLQGTSFEVFQEPNPGFLKLQLRGPGAEAQVAARLGNELPEAGKWLEFDGVGCAWLAPGEWLLFAGGEQVAGLACEFTEMLAGQLALVTELTHGRASFVVTGAAAADRIGSACPLDLREQSLGPGCCARSLFGEAHIFLARLPDRDLHPSYRLVVDQTLAAYVLRLLAEPRRR